MHSEGMLFLRISIALFLLADAAYVVRRWGGPATLYASGRSTCPLTCTLGVPAEHERIFATRDRMLASSHLVQKDGELQLWQTPHGQFWLPSTRVKFLHVILAEEELDYYAGTHPVRPGDIVLDCGADIGTFTRWALRHGATLVVAIEPWPDKVPCLHRTFATEIAQGKVIVYPKAVWDKADTLTMKGDTLVYNREGQTLQVPLVTIDSIVAELKLPKVDFIKMDIEGAEAKALAGARGVIQRFRPTISIATEHEPDDPIRMPQIVRSLVPEYRAQAFHCIKYHDVIRPEVMQFTERP